MTTENKKVIAETLNKVPDELVPDILNYLNSLKSGQKLEKQDLSSMLLSERSLKKNWLSKEEDEAWAHL